jgi:large subunit ribosomal protein L5e
MPFVKVLKNKAYFKRYQTKYRRRRDGKTDYRARKRLIAQDKNKYNSPKFRFVVRFTNKFVTCQIIRAEIIGDKVICSASSAELPRYGLKVGLKNYAAAYCTGLLCARRTLQKMGLDETYEGQEEVDGEPFIQEADGDSRPFTANLDVGIKATTTGARVFAALKGAVDGGLNVPHSEKRFVGYDREEKKYNAEDMKDRIFGEHVAEYMRYLMEEDADKYKTHFSKFIEEEVEADNLEDLYTSVHEAIREDPSPAEKEEADVDRETYKRPAKKTYEERKAAVEEKKAAMMEAADDDDDDDDEDGGDDAGDDDAEDEEEEAAPAPARADY